MPKKKNRNGKNIKPTTIEKAHFQISVINGICKFALECCGSDKVPFFIENVHARPTDTPTTAASLVSNYYAWLSTMYELLNIPALICPRQPATWQNQLGFLLPSGSGKKAYDARKKALQGFATKKFPHMLQVGLNKKKMFVSKKGRPIGKTADALCMLWVYAQGE
ncbi:MAG TPA: hypothetical protein EYN51_01155 [Flavobacteriales bacterium]|nr:hypothetical protein [Flavobacteriales bacterium]